MFVSEGKHTIVFSNILVYFDNTISFLIIFSSAQLRHQVLKVNRTALHNKVQNSFSCENLASYLLNTNISYFTLEPRFFILHICMKTYNLSLYPNN